MSREREARCARKGDRFLSQLTAASINRVFQDAVQEKEASATLMVFGLSEEGGDSLEEKMSE